MTRNILCCELAFHDNLRGDARVVSPWNPASVKAFHAVVTRQTVHNGLIERVSHMQRTCYIGWGQLD